eukprot:TRINITY_DN6712_c0_g1_i2.p2 TRINITY_DN6712_c0_g1~~TRINITY_DN6712_c0_g1_i2.p2  ORF type:complete len:340 (+),score=65.34 TRINITY_DN6712_c0_g1_i2:164-1183(+)
MCIRDRVSTQSTWGMGPGLVYLEEPDKTKHAVEGECDLLRFVAIGMQGWRLNMEDAHIATVKFGGDPQAALFGVFDGHGGREVAEYASRHLPEELLKNSDYASGKYDRALINTFLKIDSMLDSATARAEIEKMRLEFNTKSAASPSKRGLDEMEEEGPEMKGCTANVVLLKNRTLYIANAGDSRAVLAKKGKAEELSIDHKPDMESELKRITKAGGKVEEGRVEGNLNLSRAFGDLRYKQNRKLKQSEQMISPEPDVRVEKLTPDCDFLVMGCDGIYETKTSQQIVDFFYSELKGAAPLKPVVSKFMDSVLSPDYMKTEGEGCDNMTCILVKFKHDSKK